MQVTRQRARSARLLGAFLALWAAACAAETPEREGRERCARSSDCSDPVAVCLIEDGAASGRCVTECGDDRDCPEGEACADGLCTDAALTCRADRECAWGQVCRQGLCEDIEGYCQRNADCPSTQVCDGAALRCIDGDEATPCASDGDCFAGERCLQSRCAVDDAPPTPECVLNSDCDPDERCLQGACEPLPQPEGCTRHDECASGERCEQGRCVTVPECALNSDCTGGLICRAGACVPECAADRDCASGLICRAGSCEAECRLDRDCATNQACQSGRCQDAPPPDENLYTGTFQLSSTTPIQRCNDFLSIQYDARTVSALQNGTAYQLLFPSSTYYGSIQSGTFTVSWSGFQQSTAVCGEWNSANTYTGTFQGPDLFMGSLRTEHYFQVRECNCVQVFQITGTRL